jgi:chromosome segregation ATPase
MGFDYDQLKSSEDDGNFWASYSDLFMVLSLVFLLLYVVAGLRSGTNSIKNYMEFEQLKKENADYKEQIKAYNTLKDDYLTQGATQSEQETYEKLMDKLSLLKDEAKKEKEELNRQAKENAEKEEALNQYQQVVRNIINTNMLSAARMKRKNKVVTKLDKSLEEKKEEVVKLNQTVAQKEEEIEKRKQEIEQANAKLDQSVEKLKKAFKKNKINKKMMEVKIARLKKKAQEEINELQSQAEQVENELQDAKSSLTQAQREIQQKDQTIAQKNVELSELEQKKKQTEQEIENMKDEFREARAKAQKEFNEQLRTQRLSALERSRKIEEFRDQLAKQKNELDEKVQALEGEMQAKQRELAQAEENISKAKAQAQKLAGANRALAGKNQALSQDLAKAKAILEAKKKLSQKISDNLRKAGVKASVDGKTGDVILDFGEEYFDTGRSNLKGNMKTTLQKFMPAYSKSLLSDKEIASKINSVKIVGFASPTYKGRYVDPKSLRQEDREAAKYNLDLSYKRAQSIYNYIFDKKNMSYEYQQEILPLVEVAGKSYFSEGEEEQRKIASEMTASEFCQKFDCKKSQRVIIKFDMADR